MRANSISNYTVSNNNIKYKNPNFGHAFVTLSRANFGEVIAKNVDAYNVGDFRKMYNATVKMAQEVIERVNKTFQGEDVRIKTVKDLTDKIDLFIPAAGSGSRFKPLAAEVANLRGENSGYNKISIPFELGDGEEPLTILNIPMAMGRIFASKDGYRKIIADKPTGNFGDIILHYLHSGRKPKDIVVCGGDNAFDMKSQDMLEFVLKTINNPQKQLGIMGIARKPETVAGRFGVLRVGEKNSKTGFYPLEGFVEKPPFEVAKTLVTEDGTNIANTGLSVIKKESMEKLLDILRYEKKILGGKTFYIAKDPNQEIYDGATAIKWVHSLNGPSASNVKMLSGKWEDVGQPDAYLSWMNEIKNGYYLSNFSQERKDAILKSVQQRVTDNSIQFSNSPKGSSFVDDIKIIA